MSTPLDLILSVVEPVAVAYAVASGIAFGATVILWVSLKFPPKIPVSTTLGALITTMTAVIAGTLFFAGQIVEAYTSGDPLWPRAVGRMLLWEIFSVGIGVGLGVARSFAHTRKEGQ